MMTETELFESDWFTSRPLEIQAVIRKWPGTRPWLLKTTNQIVTIYSYTEGTPITVTVDVLRLLNPCLLCLLFSRRVFGIDPNDLLALDSSVEAQAMVLLKKEEN